MNTKKKIVSSFKNINIEAIREPVGARKPISKPVSAGEPIEVKPTLSVNDPGRLQERVRVEPVVDLINSAVFKKTRLMKCSVDADVVKLELVHDLKGMSKDDVKQWLQDVIDRARNADAIDRIKAERAAREFEKIAGSIRFSFCGFKVEVDPAGGVTCTYGSGVRQALEFGKGLKQFSYKLERTTVEPKIVFQQKSRKEKLHTPIKRVVWTTIASSDGTFGDVVVNDTSVELGKSYTYRFSLTYLSDNTTTTYEETVLYDKLKIVIKDFSVVPSFTEKKVYVQFNVENALSVGVSRISPLPKKEILEPYVDSDVDRNKKYEYLLSASNCWESVEKKVSTDFSDALPVIGKISYEIEILEKGVTLKWDAGSKVSSYAVERKKNGSSNWDVIYDEEYYRRDSRTGEYLYMDIDSKLVQNISYDYRICCSNAWGKTYSDLVTVKMTNSVPKPPRMLPHSKTWNNKIRLDWISSKDAKNYVVTRKNGSSTLKWETDNYIHWIFDEQSQPGVLYTYEIVAKNGWGCSEVRCYDAIVEKKEFKGKIDNCYSFEGVSIDEYEKESWTEDFQGMTTDGDYWFFTNGSGYAKLTKFPVDESLMQSSPSGGSKKRFGLVEYEVSSSGNLKSFYTEYSKHFGDLSYFEKYLFIPAYGGDVPYPEIWIVDAESLELKHRESLKRFGADYFGNLGWCAINPNDGRLYTSDSTMYGCLFSYKIVLENIGTSKPVFDLFRTVFLYDEKGNLFSEKGCMQGGGFDYYDNIYLNSGFLDSDRRPGEGIHVFKLIRDDARTMENAMHYMTSSDENKASVYEAYISDDLDVNVEYSKGVLIDKSISSVEKYVWGSTSNFVYDIAHGTPAPGSLDELWPWNWGSWSSSIYAEEPQGLAYFDFCNTKGCRLPYHSEMRKSSLHVSLLDNDDGYTSKDDIILREYKHVFRDTEEKNVYFCSSNLKVVKDNKKDEWKIVDNAIVVKKFKNSTDANRALDILKRFNKIHIIGWLRTYSLEHNYEFTAIESSNVLPKTNCTTISYVGSKVSVARENEHFEVKLNSTAGKVYCFFAHNETDAAKIKSVVEKYNKVCIIGAGVDTNGRIRSTNNLIWLEK